MVAGALATTLAGMVAGMHLITIHVHTGIMLPTMTTTTTVMESIMATLAHVVVQAATTLVVTSLTVADGVRMVAYTAWLRLAPTAVIVLQTVLTQTAPTETVHWPQVLHSVAATRLTVM